MGATEEKQVLLLRTEAIQPNPRQPRQVFEETGLRELAASIRRHGILQPLTVRRIPDGWELIAGERRLRAARLAGLDTVPCIEAVVDEQTSALLALVENLQRQDLHYFEEAEAIAAYIRRSGTTQEDTAAQLGRSPSAVANKLRLLRLSVSCREILLSAGLTERHARALLKLRTEEETLSAIVRIAKEGMSVARAEKYIESLLAEKEEKAPRANVGAFLNSLTQNLQKIQLSGIAAVSERRETESQIVLTITIPK